MNGIQNKIYKKPKSTFLTQAVQKEVPNVTDSSQKEPNNKVLEEATLIIEDPSKHEPENTVVEETDLNIVDRPKNESMSNVPRQTNLNIEDPPIYEPKNKVLDIEDGEKYENKNKVQRSASLPSSFGVRLPHFHRKPSNTHTLTSDFQSTESLSTYRSYSRISLSHGSDGYDIAALKVGLEYYPGLPFSYEESKEETNTTLRIVKSVFAEKWTLKVLFSLLLGILVTTIMQNESSQPLTYVGYIALFTFLVFYPLLGALWALYNCLVPYYQLWRYTAREVATPELQPPQPKSVDVEGVEVNSKLEILPDVESKPKFDSLPDVEMKAKLDTLPGFDRNKFAFSNFERRHSLRRPSALPSIREGRIEDLEELQEE